MAPQYTVGLGIMMALGMAMVVWLAHQVLLAFFAGFLLAIFLSRVSSLVRRWVPVPHKVLVVVLVVILFGVVISTGAMFSTTVTQQIEELGQRLPEAQDRLAAVTGKLSMYRTSIPQITVNGAGRTVISESLPLLSGIASFFSDATSVVVALGAALLMGIYGALEPAWYQRGVLFLVGEKHQARGRAVMQEVTDTLWVWLIGRLATMFVIGTLTATTLFFFQVPLALLLGVLAGLLAIIPFLGPILSAIPAVLVAMTEGFPLVLVVIGIFIVIQIVEGNLITPLVERRTIRLPPALTIGAQLLLGTLVGPLGIMLASPMVAAVTAVRRAWHAAYAPVEKSLRREDD